MNEIQGVNIDTCPAKGISWTAIFIGALVGLGLNFLLNLLCLGIGLASFSNTNEVTAFMMLGFIALAFAAFISMFAGGWIAGYLGRTSVNKKWGELYGFVAWCIALVLMIALSTHTGQLILNYNNTLNPNPTSIQVDTTPITTVAKTHVSSVNTSIATHPDQVVINDAGLTTFATFFLFFLGALGSTFGGYCGMSYKQR